MLIQKLDFLSLSQDAKFVLNGLESCTHSLIQSSNPSLLLMEESIKKKISRSILISVDFSGCSLLKGE
jgi:hypothetical protein